VWDDNTNGMDPFPADVYAAACVAFEVLTNCVLIRAETLQGLIDRHFHEDPGGLVLERVRDPQMSPLVELVRAAVVRDPARRPTATRLRAGFAAIAADLVRRSWPLPVS
jgi:hypothetical protein